MHIEELADSLQGRRFCLDLLVEQERRHDAPWRQPADLITAIMAGEHHPEALSLDGPGIIAALRETAGAAMMWLPHEDHAVAQTLFHPAMGAALLGPAEYAIAHPSTAWWGDPIDLSNQHVFAWEPLQVSAPTLVSEAWAQLELLEAVASIGDHWWSAPMAGFPRTSRKAEGLEPFAAVVGEEIPGEPATSAAVDCAVAPMQIYEINGPTDWIALSMQFPRDATRTRAEPFERATGRAKRRWVIPDWRKVGEFYAGVHLTVRGYLTTAAMALDIDDDAGTVLAGWDPDLTIWFHDLVSIRE